MPSCDAPRPLLDSLLKVSAFFLVATLMFLVWRLMRTPGGSSSAASEQAEARSVREESQVSSTELAGADTDDVKIEAPKTQEVYVPRVAGGIVVGKRGKMAPTCTVDMECASGTRCNKLGLCVPIYSDLTISDLAPIAGRGRDSESPNTIDTVIQPR